MELIGGIFQFYAHNEQDSKVCNSFFPTLVAAERYLPGPINRHARLAWCYGDPGALYAIYLSGKYTCNIGMCNYAVSRLRETALRRDMQGEQVRDAEFCHGSSSLAYIFNKMYVHTGDTIFRETALYWYKATIILGSNNQTISGYLFYGAKSGWIDDTTLLTGVTGVGLSFMSALSYEYMNWDECVMLS